MSKSRDRNAEGLIRWESNCPHFRIRVTAPFAIFSDPCYTERVSYDVITPSAAEGLIRNIYSHHGLVVYIDRIHVMRQIRKESIKINGAHTKLSMADVMKFYQGSSIKRDSDGNNGKMQLTFLRLIDVEYYIEFHLGIEQQYANEGDTIQKFAYILADRLNRGACFEHPYMGIREYCCDVYPVTTEEFIPKSPIKGTRNMGMVFYGWDRNWEEKTMSPIMYNPIMTDGVIDVASCKKYKELG